MNNFSELSLSPALQANLTRNKFSMPTPVQAKAIPHQLTGADLVITAQTGTGKTLAFLLPLLDRLLKQQGPATGSANALILSPTRELAMQIADSFALLAAGTNLRAAVVVGGLNEQRQLLAIRTGAQVIIATPGRLMDFLDRRLVKLGAARTLILDEADRMLDMGFLPTITRILAALPAERQTVFCSATIEQSVARLIETHLKNPVRVAIGSTTKPPEQVDLHLYEVEHEHKLGLLETMLREERGSFLVFARTKHGADRLAKRLASGGSKAAAIHGDRTQNQRTQALRGFQNGSYRVLVATDVAARGVHVEGIAHVVNYDLPQAPEDFIHRVGRTGRAGLRGVATTFGTKNERGEIRKIERVLNMKLTLRPVPTGLQRQQPESVARAAAGHAVALASSTQSGEFRNSTTPSREPALIAAADGAERSKRTDAKHAGQADSTQRGEFRKSGTPSRKPAPFAAAGEGGERSKRTDAKYAGQADSTQRGEFRKSELPSRKPAPFGAAAGGERSKRTDARYAGQADSTQRGEFRKSEAPSQKPTPFGGAGGGEFRKFGTASRPLAGHGPNSGSAKRGESRPFERAVNTKPPRPAKGRTGKRPF